MADFMHGLDPGKLVLGGAVLSFILSPFTAPAYNLPIFLFGMLVHESSDAVQSLKLFSGFLSASILFDIIWAFNNHQQSGFSKFLLLLLWLLKFPTAATFLAVLHQRGSQFSLGADINGPTVWSMPGGFTSSSHHQGYQVVDDEPRAAPRGAAPPPPPPPSMKPPIVVAPTPHHAPGVLPGNYQSA